MAAVFCKGRRTDLGLNPSFANLGSHLSFPTLGFLTCKTGSTVLSLEGLEAACLTVVMMPSSQQQMLGAVICVLAEGGEL